MLVAIIHRINSAYFCHPLMDSIKNWLLCPCVSQWLNHCRRSLAIELLPATSKILCCCVSCNWLFAYCNSGQLCPHNDSHNHAIWYNHCCCIVQYNTVVSVAECGTTYKIHSVLLLLAIQCEKYTRRCCCKKYWRHRCFLHDTSFASLRCNIVKKCLFASCNTT